MSGWAATIVAHVACRCDEPCTHDKRRFAHRSIASHVASAMVLLSKIVQLEACFLCHTHEVDATDVTDKPFP